MCSLNVRKGKHAIGWHFSSMNFEHNHPPDCVDTTDYVHRHDLLTEEHKAFIQNCAKILMPPSEIQQLLSVQFSDSPPHLESDDIRNVAYPNRGDWRASDDARKLLELLFDLQRADPNWYIQYETDEESRLTHLFWQRPSQRELATDVYQILIHDNTYKTNRFKLPFGVFAGVNRHGHTVTLAQCLAFKEGTTDYEWAYNCFQESVGIDPEIIFTDADPGATAAVATTWPNSFHAWCIWHIYQCVTRNLAGKLAGNFSPFLQQLKSCQRQLGKAQFDEAYNNLLEAYPAAATYLNEQLTPNVERWAAYALEVFTAGAESTQRGEGLNFHIKKHLTASSSLKKVFDGVTNRVEWEHARQLRAKARNEVNYADMGSTASQMIPDIYQAAKVSLTNHGVELLITQVQASLKYVVYAQDSDDAEMYGPTISMDTREPGDYVDANLLDLPRFKCLTEVIEANDVDDGYMALLATPRHTHAGHLKNPHWLLFSNKNDAGVYSSFYCTCGCSIRCGVPCRHFWAALLSPACFPIGFHFGQVNDLWFKAAQQPTAELQLFSYSSASDQQQLIEFSRPLFAAATARAAAAAAAAASTEEGNPPAPEQAAQDPRLQLSQKRAYGELLGLAKKAVEAALAGGSEKSVTLRTMLQHFVPGGESGATSLANPALIQHKGRPRKGKGKPNTPAAASQRPAQLAALPPLARKRAQSSQAENVPPATGQDLQRQDAPAPPHEPKRRNPPTCGICGSLGHRRNFCPKLSGVDRGVLSDSTQQMLNSSQPALVLTPIPESEPSTKHLAGI